MKILSNKEYNLFVKLANQNKQLNELVKRQNNLIIRQQKLLKRVYPDAIGDCVPVDFPNSTKGGF